MFSLDKTLTHVSIKDIEMVNIRQLLYSIFDHSKQNEQKDTTEEIAKSAQKLVSTKHLAKNFFFLFFAFSTLISVLYFFPFHTLNTCNVDG